MPDLFVERMGRGPDLILLHGWAMHSGIFAPLAARLAKRCTLHLVDLPGHGRSDRSARFDLAAVARELLARIPGAAWLGWSLGGLVGLEAARLAPGQVAALALIASNPRFVLGPDWAFGVAPEVFAAFGRDLATDYARTLNRFLALECHGSDSARTDLRELHRRAFEYGEPAPHVLDDGLRLLAGSDYRSMLPTLGIPSAWIAGARDRLVPSAALEWAAGAARGSYTRIAGGGHAPFIGHPQQVLSAIDLLLDEVNG